MEGYGGEANLSKHSKEKKLGEKAYFPSWGMSADLLNA